MKAEIQVADGATVAICTLCNGKFAIEPRKPKHNPIYCPHCKAGLVMTNEEGDYINMYWAPLLTHTARKIGEAFHVSQFPSQAIAEQWAAFEKEHPPEDILDIAKRLFFSLGQNHHNEHLGGLVFRQIMVMARKQDKFKETKSGLSSSEIEVQFVEAVDPWKQ
jgi:hypothetical protein